MNKEKMSTKSDLQVILEKIEENHESAMEKITFFLGDVPKYDLSRVDIELKRGLENISGHLTDSRGVLLDELYKMSKELKWIRLNIQDQLFELSQKLDDKTSSSPLKKSAKKKAAPPSKKSKKKKKKARR